MKPFAREFNAAVYAMAHRVCPLGYDIAEHAPSSLAELIDHVDRHQRIVVSQLNSEATIFGDHTDAEFNYAFRAWHDWTHWRIRAEFDLVGETRVALQQIADLAKVYGNKFARRYTPLILAEVIGQATYKEITGAFPADQRSFDIAYIDAMAPDPCATASARGWR